MAISKVLETLRKSGSRLKQVAEKVRGSETPSIRDCVPSRDREGAQRNRLFHHSDTAASTHPNRNRAATKGSGCRSQRQTGTALLAVLWLTAALTAIAFTVASTVRAETERTSTEMEGVRTYYLATAAIDRALLYVQWGAGFRNPDGTPKYFENGMPVLRFQFPTGVAVTEVIPETAKLNVNSSPREELMMLMMALGIEPGRAQTIVAGILDWRSPSAGGSYTQLDQQYLSLTPSFRARHASFEEIEELLLIQGVTPDLFYGSYSADAEGHFVPHAGLRDCLSVYGSTGAVDVNSAEPAVLQAVGLNSGTAASIVAERQIHAIKPDRLGQLGGGARLGIVPNSIATLRATAQLRMPDGKLSDVRRTVSALVKFLPPEWNPPFHIMRWYDNAFSVK
jgi:general secretion pathway protein K